MDTHPPRPRPEGHLLNTPILLTLVVDGTGPTSFLPTAKAPSCEVERSNDSIKQYAIKAHSPHLQADRQDKPNTFIPLLLNVGGIPTRPRYKAPAAKL